jgi:hypothetical protein
MDKKRKPQRRKSPDREELNEVAPRGASFDTEEGRQSQGMRPDIGGGQPQTEQTEMDSSMGASDASSGGGASTGIPGGGTDMRTEGRFSKGNVEEDRKKAFPEAKSKRK